MRNPFDDQEKYLSMMCYKKIEARIYTKSLYMISSKYVQVFVYNRDVQYVFYILFIQREKKPVLRRTKILFRLHSSMFAAKIILLINDKQSCVLGMHPK